MSWGIKWACPSCKQVVTPPQYAAKLTQFFAFVILSLCILLGMAVFRLNGGWILLTVWVLVLSGIFYFQSRNRKLTCPRCNEKIFPEKDFHLLSSRNKRACTSCFQTVEPQYKRDLPTSIVSIVVVTGLFLGNMYTTPYFEKKPDFWIWGRTLLTVVICVVGIIYTMRKSTICPECKNKLYMKED